MICPSPKRKFANLWPNRLIGDKYLPVEDDYNSMAQNFTIESSPYWFRAGNWANPGERATFSVWEHLKQTDPLSRVKFNMNPNHVGNCVCHSALSFLALAGLVVLRVKVDHVSQEEVFCTAFQPTLAAMGNTMGRAPLRKRLIIAAHLKFSASHDIQEE
ncbi:hypothetical protein NHQ30_008704 [Ciborinia camelliae]|nr:hypothetical protein NHQ30_008704 [Ciborinia camelliae]